MVYVLVIVPVHSDPANAPVFDVITRLPCAVQLSVAADPVRARYSVIVVAATGKAVLHSSSVAVGAVTTGAVLSRTFTIFSHREVQPFASVTISVAVNEVLQPEPAIIETDWFTLLPDMVPLPDTLHWYPLIPVVPVKIVVEPGQTWLSPVILHPGLLLFVIDTSSNDEHAPFTIVQRSTAVDPAGTPVTPDVALEGVVIVAVLLCNVQVPFSTDGELLASVKLPLLHCAWLVPAFAVVTCLLFVRDTSSKDEHAPFTIVQRSTAVVPAGTPVTVEVALAEFVIVAVPLCNVQVPVPTEGEFPASVKLPLLHCA